MIDFACIGGNKCGTTWLYEMMRQHPQINVSTNKEPHYFSRNYHRGDEWYLRSWNSDTRPRGEFSTSYLYSSDAIRRMAGDCPKVRVIVMVRHPVDRAVSHLKHVMRSGTYEDAQDALSDHPEVVDNSRYADRVAKLEDAFGPDRVFIGFFPDIKDTPDDLVARIFTFLDVDPTFTPDGLDEVVGGGFEPRFPELDRLRMAVYQTLKQYGSYSLIQFVKDTGVTNLYKCINDRSNKNRNEKQTRKTLFRDHHSLYCADLRRLVQLSSILETDHVEKWVSSLCDPSA